MTEPATASGPARSPLAVGWGAAARRGLLALVALVAAAEAVAFAVVALGGTGLSAIGALRAGGFYVAAFHRIPLRLSADALDVEGLSRALGGRASTAGVHAEVAVAPLLATALVVWLLWRGGGAVAARAGGGPLERALHGAKVAPVYALGVSAVCLVVRTDVPLESSLLRGTIELAPAALPGLVLPFAIALLAGAGGGWWSGEGTARAVAAGGWTMLVAGLGLAYGGLFLAGVVRPDGGEALLTPSTGRYFQTVFERPTSGAMVLAHHVALSPNEAAWVLVPSMGGCTGAFPAEGEPDPFLCYRRFPLEIAVPAWLAPPPPVAGPVPTTRFGAAPRAYLLFLLVPAAAAMLGGRRASLGSPGGDTGAALLGVGAGAVFALLLLAAAWMASAGASGSLELDGRPVWEGAVRWGPDLVATAGLGLAWGAIGGAAGAVLARRRGLSRR